MLNKEKILKSIKKTPTSFIEISRVNKLQRSQNKDLSSILFQLMRENKIGRNRDNDYFQIETYLEHFIGPISKTKKGFGFIDFAENQSAFIPAFKLQNIMNNDILDVNIIRDVRDNTKFLAFVNSIVERAKKTIVGTLKKIETQYILEPLDQKINMTIKVHNVDDSLIDQRIMVRIYKYGRDFIKTEFVEKYGSVLNPKSIIDGYINELGIPVEFSKSTLKEAKMVPNKVEKIPEKTIDLRKLLTITIDGETSKDFDDAITIQKNSDQTYKLFVHIADVTHYVLEKSALDSEALERGNSVYLVDRTIPMLPENLSNGICSLNPHVDRLTLTAEMDINKEGVNIGFKIYPSIINSDHRLTYTEVNEFYAGTKQMDETLSKMLNEAKELSEIIGKLKKQQGYIDFEIEEAKVMVDETGKPTSIKVVPRGISEVLIENFMVRANESVSTFMSKLDLPCIYRVHDTPTPDKFDYFKSILKVLEVDLKFNFTKDPKIFATKIRELKKIRFDDFIKISLLRTMEKAIYSPKNIGHFGLASKFYSHFTSPIRRYSDLILHRMIRTFIFNKNLKKRAHFENILSMVSTHVSDTEQKAMTLERKVADVKKAEYMKEFIGQTMSGQLVSIHKFGFFVEFENKVSGLVRFIDYPTEKFELRANNLEIKTHKRHFKIGDKIKVLIESIDTEIGQISLKLIGA